MDYDHCEFYPKTLLTIRPVCAYRTGSQRLMRQERGTPHDLPRVWCRTTCDPLNRVPRLSRLDARETLAYQAVASPPRARRRDPNRRRPARTVATHTEPHAHQPEGNSKMLISVTIQGITGIMFDRFTEDMLSTGPKTTGQAQADTPYDQAKRRILLDDKGVPLLPADNLLACIIDAGRFIKVGKRQLSTRDTTIVSSFLSIPEQFLVIRSKGGWRVDSRGIVNQSTKGRHICHRPIFDDWELDFTLDVDLTEVSEKTVRELVDRAGKQIGLGVMRPSRKGRYGQFVVRCWDCQKIKKAA